MRTAWRPVSFKEKFVVAGDWESRLAERVGLGLKMLMLHWSEIFVLFYPDVVADLKALIFHWFSNLLLPIHADMKASAGGAEHSSRLSIEF